MTARYLRNEVATVLRGTPLYLDFFDGIELALNGNTSFFPPGPSLAEFLVLPLFCLDEGVVTSRPIYEYD